MGRHYASCFYRAWSWTKLRRLIVKVECHPDELDPCAGFMVTSMTRPEEFPAPRLNETPRKRTISALEVCHGRVPRQGGSGRAAWRDRKSSGDAAPGRGGRMSRQRKTAAVLRLLRGEGLETVSRSLGVTAATLTRWRDAFLSAGEAALASRPESGEALENDRLKAKLGEVMMERDLLHEKIAVLEAGRPLALRRRRP